MTTRPRVIRARAKGAPPRRRPAPGTRVVRGTRLQALEEAAQILRQAEEEATDTAARARAHVEELRRRAEEDARAQAGALLVTARDRAARVIQDARTDLTRLAVHIAEKLLGEELRLHPDRVCQIVEQALSQAGAARRAVLRVNPADLPLLEQARARLQQIADVELLQLEPDPDVARGGSVLETELGQLDGRLETQLAAIMEALQEDR